MPATKTKIIIACFFAIMFSGFINENKYPVLNHSKLADEYFKEDAQWYIDTVGNYTKLISEIQETTAISLQNLLTMLAGTESLTVPSMQHPCFILQKAAG
jgi:hypothetical protein